MKLSRLKEEWTVQDWIDFYYALSAFSERVIARHTGESSGTR